MPAGPGPHRFGLPPGPVVRHAGQVPILSLPTVTVRDSYLAGETADATAHGRPTDWIDEAGLDFPAFVARRRALNVSDGVPAAEFWFVDGPTYYGSLLMRMRLTRALEDISGHLRTRVMPAFQGQGHEFAMQTQALVICRDRGLPRALVQGTPTGDGRWWLDATVAATDIAVPIDPDAP
jgi:GNAT superfamily N-acetyltransferase